MLFAREINDSPLFDVEAFDRRYLRQTADNDSSNTQDEGQGEDNAVPSDDIFLEGNTNEDQVQEEREVSLSDREKFKMVIPIMTNIANLVSYHSTNMFLQYVDEFKKLENLVRKGKSVMGDNSFSSNADTASVPGTASASASVQLEAEVPGVEIPITHQVPVTAISSTPAAPNIQPPTTTSTPSNSMSLATTASAYERQMTQLSDNPIAEPTSKYSLKFKPKVVRKGRPKKNSKQVSFNKTTHDRSENGKKNAKENKKSTKKSTKRRKTADILEDMTNMGEETDEEYSGSELLDGVQLHLPRNVEYVQRNVDTGESVQFSTPNLTYSDNMQQCITPSRDMFVVTPGNYSEFLSSTSIVTPGNYSEFAESSRYPANCTMSSSYVPGYIDDVALMHPAYTNDISHNSTAHTESHTQSFNSFTDLGAK